MAQLLVRNLEEDIKERLRKRAKAHGCSMEEEARDILRSALLAKAKPHEGLGTRIAKRFAGIGVDFEVPDLRGEQAQPPSFRK
jgi:plasmid stability protein